MYQEKINRQFYYFDNYYKKQLLGAKSKPIFWTSYSSIVLRQMAINRNLMKFKNAK